jgi:hypothetical protein
MSKCHQINSSSDALAAAIAAEIASNLYSFPSSNTSAVKVPVSSTSSPANAAMNIGASNSSSGDDNNVLSETDCDVDNNENDDDENNNNNDSNSNSNNNDNEDDTERRLARSRERNREHARRTRRRKKVQLEVFQEKVKNLRGENKALKQSLEECTIASILVGFSGVTDDDVDNDHDNDATIQSLIKEATDLESKDIFKTTVGGIGPGGKRKRFVSDASESDIAATATDADDCASPSSAATGNNNNNINNTTAAAAVSFPLKLEINGRIVLIGGDGRTHINWKTGIYTDDNGIRSQLTKQQLESLRYVLCYVILYFMSCYVVLYCVMSCTVMYSIVECFLFEVAVLLSLSYSHVQYTILIAF